jgi:putative membrane protein
VNNKDAQAVIQAPDTSLASHNPQVPATTTDAQSADFAMKAAKGGMMEVDLGRWAQDHSANARVKEFGAMMVTDHSKANDELKSIAAAKNLSLPATVDPDQKKHMDDMMAMKSADFDRMYVNMMVEDHNQDVAEFENASKNLADADLKSFAARTLPVLKKHQAAIKSIKAKM